MKCIDGAALNSRASPLFSPVLDLELDQMLTQTAAISRVPLADVTEKSMSGYKIKRKTKLLLKSLVSSGIVCGLLNVTKLSMSRLKL